MKRILILRGGALGDFIVTLPALRLLHDRWPSAKIELVGNVRAAELGIIAGVLDAVHTQAEARWAQLYGSAPLSPEFQTWLDGFDLIVSFWPDPDRELCRHFAHRGAAFIARDANAYTAPAAAHFCAALKPLGLTTDDYAFQIDFPETIRVEAARRCAGLDNLIALHPGSGSTRKNWPTERWTELIVRLQSPLLMVSGEAENTLPICSADQPIVHARDWPLPVLGSALARSRLFIGHDSGISHLAAVAGARCVLLFGPTEPAVWAPPGAQVIRRGDSLAAISVEEVVATIAARLNPATPDR